MTRLLAGVLWAFVTILSWQASQAQSTQGQFLPEVDLYWTLNPDLRIQMTASRTRDGASYNSATVGPTLNIFLKPLSSERRTTADDSERNLLTFGVGYRSISATDKAEENRIELDLAPKYPLPAGMLLDDRNRIDLRFIADNFTWRYRNRLTLQRTFEIHSVKVTPYARGEVFYDISSSSWNKTTYALGGTVGLTKRIDLEPYYERENNTGSTPNHVNAFGLTFHAYFRKATAMRGK
jgi:hypothetical protein